MSTIESFERGLIVSCQALEGEPLYAEHTMALMALAARQGGAVGIRANAPADIASIKSKVDLPLIGLWKQDYADSGVYITPTIREADAVIRAGADVVALDATGQSRPQGATLEELVDYIRRTSDCLTMADVSTLEEGIEAERLGFDIVSTTLSGYTPYSRQSNEPDFRLIADLASRLSVPVVAEGRIRTPEQADICLRLGAHAVVVGGAITRPQTITRSFVEAIGRREAGK